MYFCVAEATRHFGGPVTVVLTAHDRQLQLIVSGSDRGGLQLGDLRDRVEAAGGSISLIEKDGHTTCEVRAQATPPAAV
jgi:signal transduction histidine kinase